MKLVKSTVNLVLLGSFNPDSFLPKKLAEGKVITSKMANSASLIALMPTQTVHFILEWAEILVLQDRLQITSLEAPHIRVCDFVLKVPQDLAINSTVSQFGINVVCHYDLESVDARNNFGKRIAPPDVWGAWGQKISESMSNYEKGTYLQGGVINVKFRKPFNHDGINGWLDISVTPSPEVPNNTGVLLQSNHHHQVLSIDPDADADKIVVSDTEQTSTLLKSLSDNYEKSIEDAFSIFKEALSE